MASLLKHAECLQATATLLATAGIHEAHFVTEAVGQFGAMHAGLLDEVLTHPFDVLRTR